MISITVRIQRAPANQPTVLTIVGLQGWKSQGNGTDDKNLDFAQIDIGNRNVERPSDIQFEVVIRLKKDVLIK